MFRNVMLFWHRKLRRQQFKYRVKYFLLIFLHGSIELVELYKTVYIKSFSSHFSEIKNFQNDLQNPKNCLKTVFFYLEEKNSVFSIQLAFFIVFTNKDASEYTG